MVVLAIFLYALAVLVVFAVGLGLLFRDREEAVRLPAVIWRPASMQLAFDAEWRAMRPGLEWFPTVPTPAHLLAPETPAYLLAA